MVGVAALFTLDRRGNMERARVGITGLAAKAFRATAVENALVGKAPGGDTISTAAVHAVDDIDPLSDIHAAAGFPRRTCMRLYAPRDRSCGISRAE